MTAAGGAEPTRRWSTRARHLAALLVIAVSCPGAMLAGALLVCASQGFDPECAMTGIMMSPFILIGAGIVAGLLTRGWRGLALVLIGVVIGMVTILVVSFLAGNLVLISPVEGIIATIWFGGPVTLGYGIGRVTDRIVRRATA